MLPVLGALRPWADPGVTALGRAPMHTTVRRDADLTLDLSGEWSFALFDHPDLIGPADLGGDLVGDEPARRVKVPGNWTMQDTGDLPHYTNVVMPFAGLPPQLPARCPAGVYRRRVRVAWPDHRVFVQIGGAESVHAVYLDGQFIGYGTDSKLGSEYEITDHLRTRTGADDAGCEVEIAVVVVRYSAHSYIEDQDTWWMAGLHRPVLLEARPVVHLRDVTLCADRDPCTGVGDLQVRCEVEPSPGEALGRGWHTRLVLIDPAGEVMSVDPDDLAAVDHRWWQVGLYEGAVSRHARTLPAVKAWSAETPALYGVQVELLDSSGVVVDSVRTRCGFRRVEIAERSLLVNGARVWIFGVNRHDHHPDHGTAVGVADMRADLLAMRAHNITAVRTAHYPNDPRFLDLCDEIGMYVIDEANIEGHAFTNLLCRDPRYRSAFLERGARMVQRDRNHPSVISWSLGNETGYGPNHDALAAWIRASDPTRPLHYEGAIFHGDHGADHGGDHLGAGGELLLDVAAANASLDVDPVAVGRQWVDGGRQASDLVCPMYPPIAAIEHYGLAGQGDRPLIMCEYSHAMGNSNGSLADYWEVITRTPGLQGGFIWEWKDHALRAADGSGQLWVGGDFGDTPHDGNFVADGLMGAEGDAHPALQEVAWVYRPVTVTGLDDDPAGPVRVQITNRRSFSGLDDLEAQVTVFADNAAVPGPATEDLVLWAGVLAVPAVAPHTTAVVDLPVEAQQAIATARLDGIAVWVTVTWHQRAATAWAPAGHRVAWDQIALAGTGEVPMAGSAAAPVVSERPYRAAAVADPAVLAEVMLSVPEVMLRRAAVDNDGFKLMPDTWEGPGIGGRALGRWVATGVQDRPAVALVAVDMQRTDAAGGWVYTCRVEVPDEFADLGRVGVRWSIPPRFDHLRYFGRGPHENYPDRAAGALLGVWEHQVDALPYLVPQEFGLRTGVRWLCCEDRGSGEQIWVRSLGPAGPDMDGLQMAVVGHATEDLYGARRPEELAASDRLWVHVDVAHRGLGTASCGPDVAPQYRIAPGVYEWAFWVGATRP